jgi:hypothetical protein
VTAAPAEGRAVPAAAAPWWRRLPPRREERLLALVLAVAVLLCLATGTGFTPGRIFFGYLRFFGPYVALLYAVTRAAALARERWRPQGRAGRRLLGWLGGPAEGGGWLLATDAEFLRGIALLLVSLTVYTSVKVRIPFINAAVGDPFFLALDRLFLPDGLLPWIEGAVAARPGLAGFLSWVYLHDYKWMVVLLLLLHVRGDRPRLRWLFGSVCLLYLLGILATAAYPSYGPFFFDRERFAWLAETAMGGAQRNLGLALALSQQRAAAGEPILAQAFLGIAAFPSLHVAHMALLAVIGWRPWRAFALFVAAVGALTTVATVAFGWHYLVDAVGGAALAVAVPLALKPLVFGREAGRRPGAAAEGD